MKLNIEDNRLHIRLNPLVMLFGHRGSFSVPLSNVVRSRWLPGAALVVVGLLALTLVLVTACRRGDVTVRLGEQMSLSIGQTAVVSGEGLTIAFQSVPEDSRCARDVTCVWAGQVRCAVDVTANGETTSLDLIRPGLTDEPASQEHGGYVFTFSVDPYPEEAGVGIAPGDYVLHLTVSK